MAVANKYSKIAAKYLQESTVFDDIRSGVFVEQFLHFLKTDARTDRGEKVIITNWLLEYARIQADFRFPDTVVTGCAQLSKTMIIALLQTFGFARGLNSVFTFATTGVVDRQVTNQLKPLVEPALNSQKHSTRDLASYTNSYWRHAVLNCSAYFVGATSAGVADGAAGQASKIVSFTADISYNDEISGTPLDFIEQVEVRLGQSRIVTKPFRKTGTPGSGRGAEVYYDRADYKFEAACICPHCQEITTLSPIGALVLTNEKGEWHDNKGLPIAWRKNKEGKIYVGCSSCDGELNDLSHRAFFYDFTNKMRLKDLKPDPDTRVGICISPLLRIGFNPVRFLKKWLEASDLINFFQQELGLPYLLKGFGISAEAVKSAINRPLPNLSGRVITVAGIDQGTSNLYLSIARYHLPNSYQDTEVLLEEAFMQVLYLAPVHLDNVREVCDRFQVDLLAIDIDPSRYTANIISRKLRFPTILCDQRSENQLELYKDTILQESGVDYNAIALRDTQIKQDLVAFFNSDRVTLPPYFKQYLDDKSPTNPLTQLTSVTWDAELGKFVRPSSKNDDLFYAAMFSVFGIRWYLDNDPMLMARLYQNI
jgi:hypothetical protein